MAFSRQDQYSYSTPLDDFERTRQNAYSHGFEKIYALENVDIRSVRKITSFAAPTKLSSRKISKTDSQSSLPQLEFPFEFPFNRKMDQFVFQEPLQVIGFSKRVESWLLAQDKKVIGDLLENDRQSIIPLKGIGQGHLDEIHEKLKNYLEVQADEDAGSKFNIVSWLKTLIGDLEAKKCTVLLQAFNLPSPLPLTPAENAEVRKLSNEIRTLWIEESLSLCRTPLKMEQIEKDVQQIVEIYIKPWISKHLGIARLQEVEEYLLKLSAFYPHFDQALSFVSKVFFDGQFPFAPYLNLAEESLYCDSHENMQAFTEVIEVAQTYFYQDHLHYPLDSLVGWMSNEFAKKWQGFADNFIERALRLSSSFRVRKDFSGQLIVKLS